MMDHDGEPEKPSLKTCINDLMLAAHQAKLVVDEWLAQHSKSLMADVLQLNVDAVYSACYALMLIANKGVEI